MPIRKILMPLVGGENDGPALSAGFALGVGFSAHVDACFVRPNPEDVVPYSRVGSVAGEREAAEYIHQAELIGKRAAAKSRRQFDRLCKKYGVSKVRIPTNANSANAHWHEVVGRATRVVPEHSRLADVTVFGGALEDFHRLVPNVLECTLLYSGRPLLIAAGDLHAMPPDIVAIAWDGSLSSARVVAAAWPFLERAKQIYALSVDEGFVEVVNPEKLVEYLAWHGFKCRKISGTKDDRDVAHMLLAMADEIGAGLLAMGGYAHSRFEEVIFGGTTLSAIRNARLPLLLMH